MAIVTFPTEGTNIEAFDLISGGMFLNDEKFTATTPSLSKSTSSLNVSDGTPVITTSDR